MRLTHLSLTNFRNFARLETAFVDGTTVLVGANAQGKTSLLEAIYYLTAASSPHATSDRQLINFSILEDAAPFARIVAEVRRGGRDEVLNDLPIPREKERPQKIEIRLILSRVGPAGEQRIRKEVLINGVKQRVRDLAGTFNAVMFLPKDMRVVEGSPSERRRFMDDALCQADPLYANALAEYRDVLSQRNALLKQLQERAQAEGELLFWDEKLCEHAATLMQTRARTLHELQKIAAPIHSDLSRGQETLRLEYLPSHDPLPRPDKQMDLPIETSPELADIGREKIQSSMLDALQRKRREEIARGNTTTGPHRDDFGFTVNGIDLRLYGSRGQNRTAMLATQLAEVSWLQDRTGETPVLLLDEVVAELDPERREDLLQRVEGAQQVILTAADLNMFTPTFCEQATIWQITDGEISPFEEGNRDQG